ncbi:SLBB domain-containing protein [Dyadobacter sp. 3J3]|uniref:SLBB domain-containing protein n=1 Tax=Dyadobacter sp. 3J3 TaxID=2606600 RepID=UPI00135AA441|nr:SLBB domain-containing protein [Dyadobacter sp. 3J3]
MTIKKQASFIFAFSFFLTFFFVTTQGQTQDQPQRNSGETSKQQSKSNNLGGVNEGNMSDAEVQDIVKRMRDSGYSEAELEQAAKVRGMDATQIQQFRDRVKKLENTKKTGTTIEESKKQERSEYKKNTNENDVNVSNRIFGSQFFGSAFSSFEPNLNMPTPANYVIGPSDELLLDLTGDNEVSYKLRVSPESFISIEYIGRVSVGGLTIEQAKNKIKAQMDNTYPSLRSGRTQLSLNLGNIRSIKVIISGEVMKPGTYTLPSITSVFNALYSSGGPNDKGSFRTIQVIRNNKVVATVDLYDFLLNGIQTANIRLQDLDVIHIPIYQIHVDVIGEVKRSMIYEIKQNESLSDILRYAGDFSDNAYKARVKIIQNTFNARKIVVVPLSDFPNYIPKNGDKIYIDSILDKLENKVQINGAVTRPGQFTFKPGLKLSELIKQADGLAPDVFMSNGYIIRLNADNTNSIVSFDLAEVMKGGISDIELERNDVAQISSISDLRDQYTVSIDGEVRRPGSFEFAGNLSVENLIQMAGGFKEGANPADIEISRRIKGADLSKSTTEVAQIFHIAVDSSLRVIDRNFLLQPFDIVSVHPVIGFTPLLKVQVSGEIIRPGVYTIISKNERISDIVKRAGGLTAFAYPEGASLKRPAANIVNTGLDEEEKTIRQLNLARLSENGNDEGKTNPVALVNVSSDLVGIELDKILNNPMSRNDLILKDGDVIVVPSLLQTVKISGEVLRPISVVYEPGRSFRYYINSAGGFTHNAFKKGSFISHSNGSVRGTKRALLFNNYPEVKPGSEISVPRKAERERMSVQSWVGLSTAIASLATLVFAIIRR